MSYNHTDPFAPQAKYPAVKWPNVGDTRLMTITEIGELTQMIDFETNLPSVSKAGNPKMQLRVLVDMDGEDHALYVPQFSNLWKAIQTARADAGEPLAPMGVLWIQRTADIPVEGNRILMARGYTAKYKAPDKPDLFKTPPAPGIDVSHAPAAILAAQTEAPF